MKLLFKIFTFFLFCSHFGFANDDKPATTPATKTEAVANAEAATQQKVITDTKMLAELNKAFGTNTGGYKYKPEARVDKMLDVKGNVSALAAAGRSDAKKLFSYLDQKDSYKVDSQLEDADLLSLPLGLRKTFGNTTADVGILNANFYSGYTEITVFVRLKTTITDANSISPEKELFFGATNVRFSKKNGITNFTAVLLGDYPLNYQNYTIVLKGGANLSTGTVTNKTFVTVNCGHFQSAGLEADIVFPENQLKPLEPLV